MRDTRTGLLVSVRSAAEAEVALAGGADVIDVKEPGRGALGPAEPRVWREVLQVVNCRVPTSAALGELHSDPIEEYGSQVAQMSYAKIGLSNWRRRQDSVSKWVRTRMAIADCVCVVPVVYADVEATGWKSFSASVIAAVALASESKSPLLVIDTFEKRGRTLLDLTTIAELDLLSRNAAKRQVQFVLAGSLDERAIEMLLPLAPAYFGVRGAACMGGREGAIDLARVKSLANLVHEKCQMAAS